MLIASQNVLQRRHGNGGAGDKRAGAHDDAGRRRWGWWTGSSAETGSLSACAGTAAGARAAAGHHACVVAACGVVVWWCGKKCGPLSKAKTAISVKGSRQMRTTLWLTTPRHPFCLSKPSTSYSTGSLSHANILPSSLFTQTHGSKGKQDARHRETADASSFKSHVPPRPAPTHKPPAIMSSASKHVLLTAASTAALVAALTVLLQSHFGKLASRRNKAAAVLSPERKKMLERAEREDLHKALAEVMELVEQENENGAALERVQEKLRWLEGKLAANDIAFDELTDSFEEALRRHQHQTTATLTPLRNEVTQLKEQLNELAILLGANPAPSGSGGGKQQPRRLQEQGEGSGVSGSFGEASKSNFSHLATVATALGMKAAFAERARTGSVDAATPAYIISDWSELSSK